MFLAAILVAIGNSDDKLTQKMWRQFFKHTLEALDAYGTIKSVFISESVSQFQNAAYRVDFTNKKQMEICKNYLSELALRYEQDHIEWTPMHDTELLLPHRSHVVELPLPKALNKPIG